MAKIVDREQKRADIAEKAIEVFAEKGFEKATIQDIAQKAAIAKGSVYQYFETKQDILVKITHDFLGGFAPSVSSFARRIGSISAFLQIWPAKVWPTPKMYCNA